MQNELTDELGPPPPNTWKVIGLLVGAALIISYLWAYAVTNALVSAEFISRWPPGRDPRPMRMCIGFISLLGGFGFIGTVARWLSRRQLRRIDAIEDA